MVTFSETSRNWSKADPNAAAALVMQTRKPVLLEGPPGAGKTSVVLQWTEALKREAIYLIGSTHAPEDFSGIPFLSEDKKFFAQVPPKFAHRMTFANMTLILDELTTVPPHVRAGMLSMLTEGRLGDCKIHPDTMMIGACNPSSMAPNASPLERSMANRFFHWKWETDKNTWDAGMLSEDDTFEPAWFPVVPADYMRFAPEFGALLVTYTNKNSGDWLRIPESDEELSFPTPRSLKYLRDALAAARSVDAPANIMRQIAQGWVGKTTGANIIQFWDQRDLVDPEEVLAGTKTFKHDKKRPDLTVTLLTSLVTAVKRNYTQERMTAAVCLFCNNVGNDTADLVLTQLRHLVNARPEGSALSAEAMAALKSFGKRIPDNLKKKKAA